MTSPGSAGGPTPAGKERRMLSVVTTEQAHDELRVDLDAIVREGARRMLAAALEAEGDDYLAAFAAERDEGGRRLVVRNGHARQREVTTVAGAVGVRAPRVDDRRVDPVTGQRARFRSVILPPWCRRSPKVAEVLPLLYLHGLSTGDFVPALEAFFGSWAGLSAAVITRLVAAWQADDQAFAERELTDRDYVYRLRVHLGGRGALPRTAGTGPPVLPGNRGRARRRHQGAGCRGRRRTRVHPVVGRGPARPAPPRHARAVVAVGDGALGLAGAVGGAGRGLPSHPPPARLGPQGRQRARLLAQGRARRRAHGAGRAPRRAHRDHAEQAIRALVGDDRGQVAQGGGQAHRRRRGAADVLRLPGRALAAPEDQQPDLGRPSPRSGCGPGSPRAQAPRPPGWRWRSSCWKPPRTAGGRSTAPTWSRWCAPAPGS